MEKMDTYDVATCDLCGCALTEINEGIDHINYENWDGEVVTLCVPCLERIREALCI